jgi:DNA-binding beta-propeller fold protein YncE
LISFNRWRGDAKAALAWQLCRRALLACVTSWILVFGVPGSGYAAAPSGERLRPAGAEQADEATLHPGGFQGFASPSEIPEWARGKPVQFELPPAEPQTWEKAPPESVEDGPRGGSPTSSTNSAPDAAAPLLAGGESEKAESMMRYNGGRVQHGVIHVYVTFWGSGWNAHTAEKNHILELFRYLNNSPYAGVVSQYFDTTGYVGTEVSLSSYTDGNVVTPEQVSATKLEVEARKSIEAQGWPAPTFDSDYVILPAPGFTEQAGFVGGCAHHAWNLETGSPLIYVAYPTGVHADCAEGRAPWEAMQIGSAIEWAQSATDPQPYHSFGNTLPSGWEIPGAMTESGIATYEIGEVCALAGRVEVAPEVWVPRLRDNYLLAANGTYCAAQDSNPIRYGSSVGGTQIPAPHRATVTGSIQPGGWPASYRFHVTDPSIGYSATVPAQFASAGSGWGGGLSAELPPVKGGQNYSVTLESYSALTEADPPLSSVTSVLTASGSFTTPSWLPVVIDTAVPVRGTNSLTLQGTIDPQGEDTQYHVEYGRTEQMESSTAPVDVGAGVGPVPFTAQVGGLKPDTSYFLRVVATNGEGTSRGALFTGLTMANQPTLAATFGTEGSGAGQFVHPAGIATDAEGDVFVVDKGNDRVEKFDSEGKYLSQFGSPGSGNGQFNGPTGIAVSSARGRILVADTGNHRVQVFNLQGQFQEVLGVKEGGPLLQANLVTPTGVAFFGTGQKVLVADPGIEGNRGALLEFTEAGTEGHHGMALLHYPENQGVDAVATTSSGNIWITTNQNKVLLLTQTGEQTVTRLEAPGSGPGQLGDPAGIALDPSSQVGNFYVVERGNGRVQQFSSLLSPQLLSSFGAGQFASPEGIAVGAGSIYVSDTAHSRISIWHQVRQPEVTTGATTGIGRTSATLTGTVAPEGASTSYRFEYGPTAAYGSSVPVPEGALGSGFTSVTVSVVLNGLKPESVYHYRLVATNPEGTSYGADRELATVPAPSLISTFGTEGSGAGQFVHPAGIATDAEGDVFVVDKGNDRVEKFDSEGKYLSQFGSPGSGNGQFNGPTGIAVSSARGRILVADTGNHRVQVFNLQGQFQEVLGVKEGGPLLQANLVTPTGVAFFGTGQKVLVADPGIEGNRGALLEFTEAGTEGHHGMALLHYPENQGVDAVATTSSGNIWITTNQNKVLLLTPEGSQTVGGSAGAGPGVGRNQLSDPAALAVEAGGSRSGNVYVVERGNDRVQGWSVPSLLGGPEWITEFGSAGSGNGQLTAPEGIAFGLEGTILVSDSGDSRIELWGRPGAPAATTTTAAGVEATTATLTGSVNPMGVGTTYCFEYGQTTSYGSKIPVPEAAAGSGFGRLAVTRALSGLQAGATYHYRLVATNGEGTTDGADMSFTLKAPPTATTGAAGSISTEGATLNGTVAPNGSETRYHFEYGPTTSYGTSTPETGAGSGTSGQAEASVVTGLTPSTTYHFRIVASSAAGTTYGEDGSFTTRSSAGPVQAELEAMATTDPFNATTSAVSNYKEKWTALPWDGTSSPKGEDRSNGWGPVAAFPSVAGASYGPTVSDLGTGSAVEATMQTGPGVAERYFSLWLDLPSPPSAKAGYQLKFYDSAANKYTVSLVKWIGGSPTVLNETSNYGFLNGNSLALADEGGTVSAWVNTGSGFAQLTSAADSTYSGGTVAVEAAGNNTRLTNLRFATLQPKAASMNAALGGLRLDDEFAGTESPLSEGGIWAALAWDYNGSGHSTGRVATGWGPYDAFVEGINGGYWTTATFADTGSGDGAAAVLTASPGSEGRHFELLLDLQSPATVRSGYELRLTQTAAANTYNVSLEKEVAGTATTLASKAAVSFPPGSRFAIVDKAGVVSAWTATASGEFTQLLSAVDATFTGGYSGIAGAGNATRLTSFRSGQLAPS